MIYRYTYFELNFYKELKAVHKLHFDVSKVVQTVQDKWKIHYLDKKQKVIE